VDSLTWDSFWPIFNWFQGEHVTLLGPTGEGKTTTGFEILRKRYEADKGFQRAHIAALGIKKRDSTLTRYAQQEHYRVIREWPPPALSPRVILWPRINDIATYKLEQQHQFMKMMDDIFIRGGYTLFLDEVGYLTDDLKLKHRVTALWQQGRSNNITVVAAMQEPVYIPRQAYGQIKHLFVWKNPDLRRIKTIAEIAGEPDLAPIIRSLKEHEMLYIGTRSGTLVKTRVR
jgi:hypothetical protein